MLCLALQTIRVNWIVSLSDYEAGSCSVSSPDANVHLLQCALLCSQVTNCKTIEILLDFYHRLLIGYLF